MDISVNFIYKVTHHKPLEIPFHTHNCHELVLYTQGKGEVEAGERKFKYEKNSLMIVPPNALHNERNLSNSCNIVVGFRSEIDIVPFDMFQANSTVISIVQNMLHEEAVYRDYSDEIISLQIHRLILTLLRLKSEAAHKKDFSFILNNIDNYIEENMSLPIGISDFAEMYNYSPSRFRHIFTENVGISPKQYIISKRLERAKTLLETAKMSVTNIAHECGFYDVSQFSKMFKQHYLLTPSEYRERTVK